MLVCRVRPRPPARAHMRTTTIDRSAHTHVHARFSPGICIGKFRLSCTPMKACHVLVRSCGRAGARAQGAH
eukprot:11034044-Alexandrium_andersonii.AAC.1